MYYYNNLSFSCNSDYWLIIKYMAFKGKKTADKNVQNS